MDIKFSTGMKNKNYNIIQKKKGEFLTNSPTNKLTNSNGFTLLFATLIGALVLAVGMAILNIALKQLQLSASGRESQKAFYSADSGIECALFLDRGGANTDCRLGVFGTPSLTTGGVVYCGGDAVPPINNECFGKLIDVTLEENFTGANPYVVSSFELQENNTSGPGGGDNFGMCFSVEVKKVVDSDLNDGDDVTQTIIESRGYNNCNPTGTGRYERAIRVKNF